MSKCFHEWSWRLALVLFGALCGVLAFLPRAAAQEPATKKSPITRERPQSTVNRMLDGLEEEYAQTSFSDQWAWRLKGIVDIGPDAVPDLIAELDATDSDLMQRSASFMLRAIDDKRAVPALIRALPKALRKPGSDMGCLASDEELLAFMQKHDLNTKEGGKYYDLGRPVREISGTLQKLTGVKQGEEEIYSVFLRGNPRQQRLQRALYQDRAERWAKWWEGNWKEHLSDEKYALVNLPKPAEIVPNTFPHGAHVKVNGRSSGHTAEPDNDPTARRSVFYDLDTGRMLAMPEVLKKLEGDPQRLDAIHDWAAREGIDLMGTLVQPPGAERPHYVIRGLGLAAWEIDPARYETFDREIAGADPLPLGRPAAGLLLHYDEASGSYDWTKTAAFLFATREGGHGALFVGVEVLDTNVVVGIPAGGNPALNPVGFFKGRRFSFKMIDDGEGEVAK